LIHQLVARFFRNLEPTWWQLGIGTHLLVGGTGAGKTALLEAIYVALTTRSFRAGTLSDCLSLAAVGGGGFSVLVEIEQRARVQLEVRWSAALGVWRQRNEQRSRLMEHLTSQPVITWTSQETVTWTGPPSLRRRFIDRGMVGARPETLELLQHYRKLLAEKRALLKRRGLQRSELETWNALLAVAAHQVISARASYVVALHEALRETCSALPFPLGQVDLRYRPSPKGAETEDAIVTALQAAAVREIEQRRPLLGPHLDHIELFWNHREVSRVASAGERKTLGLLVLVAQRRLMEAAGRSPVLLVDDCDTELDRGLFGALWGVLADGAQTVVSSNRPEAFLGLPIEHRFGVDQGRLTRL
jgi:DNA replication and repair protein RecF